MNIIIDSNILFSALIKNREDPIKAGLREIKEETGLNCRIIAELKF